jgi:hypothetical protein
MVGVAAAVAVAAQIALTAFIPVDFRVHIRSRPFGAR